MTSLLLPGWLECSTAAKQQRSDRTQQGKVDTLVSLPVPKVHELRVLHQAMTTVTTHSWEQFVCDKPATYEIAGMQPASSNRTVSSTNNNTVPNRSE